jgi:hypothetical protein
MLRNLDQEFRGNERPGQPYSRPFAPGPMKNACSPSPRDVKIRASRPRCPAAASGGAGTQGTFKARTVHRTSSKELVKVLGHRRPERLRRR